MDVDKYQLKTEEKLTRFEFISASVMKNAQPQITKKWPSVTIDPALNDCRDKVLFAEKLEHANNVLKTAKLPPNKNRR